MTLGKTDPAKYLSYKNIFTTTEFAKDYKTVDEVKLLCCYDLFDGHHYAITDWHMWIKDRDTDVKPTPVRARDKYEEISDEEIVRLIKEKMNEEQKVNKK